MNYGGRELGKGTGGIKGSEERNWVTVTGEGKGEEQREMRHLYTVIIWFGGHSVEYKLKPAAR